MSVVRLWGVGVGSGEGARLPPLWLGFGSRTWRHMWVEFVASCRPCHESFFSGSSVFLSPPKKHIPKPNSTWKQWRRATSLKFHYFSIIMVMIFFQSLYSPLARLQHAVILQPAVFYLLQKSNLLIQTLVPKSVFFFSLNLDLHFHHHFLQQKQRTFAFEM